MYDYLQKKFTDLSKACCVSIEGPPCLRRASAVNSILVRSRAEKNRVQFEFTLDFQQSHDTMTAKFLLKYGLIAVVLSILRYAFADPLLCLCYLAEKQQTISRGIAEA